MVIQHLQDGIEVGEVIKVSCVHALSDLKPEGAEISGTGTIIVRFHCLGCGANVTKEFLARAPEPQTEPIRSRKPELPQPGFQEAH